MTEEIGEAGWCIDVLPSLKIKVRQEVSIKKINIHESKNIKKQTLSRRQCQVPGETD